MSGLPPARALRRPPLPAAPQDMVALLHHERLLRRKRLATLRGEAFLVDLPRTARVEAGDAFELEDGRLIGIGAAEEPLLEVTGADLPRLAWHIGNRHAPCEIAGDRLFVAADPVMRRMLEGLGAAVAEVRRPFAPEGGAYGEGGTMGHSHGPFVGPGHGHGHGDWDGIGTLAGTGSGPGHDR